MAGAGARVTPSRAPRGGLMQIGQVAERTGLSLRTIRWYESEVRQLLALLDDLDAGGGDRAPLRDRLQELREAATARIRALEEQLHVAQSFAATLDSRLDA